MALRNQRLCVANVGLDFPHLPNFFSESIFLLIGIETILKTLMEVLLSVTQRQKTENVAKEMQKRVQYIVGNINIIIK